MPPKAKARIGRGAAKGSRDKQVSRVVWPAMTFRTGQTPKHEAGTAPGQYGSRQRHRRVRARTGPSPVGRKGGSARWASGTKARTGRRGAKPSSRRMGRGTRYAQTTGPQATVAFPQGTEPWP